MKKVAGTPARAKVERIFGAPALSAPASNVRATTWREVGSRSGI